MGIRPAGPGWEALPQTDRDRWRALSEIFPIRDFDEFELWSLKKVVQCMSAQLEKLEAAIRRNSDAIDSGITLIQGLATELRAARLDPQKIEELASAIEGKASALAQAIVDNTPVPPTPEG